MFYLYILFIFKFLYLNLTDVKILSDTQGRIKTALGPGAMTYCRAPHQSRYIYI